MNQRRKFLKKSEQKEFETSEEEALDKFEKENAWAGIKLKEGEVN